jgi:hypothetical protein
MANNPHRCFVDRSFAVPTPCPAAYDGSVVGRIGPIGSPGPPATEGMSRRRVPPQVTHPARTIIGTDNADAPGPMVGPRTWRCPNTPKPRRSTRLPLSVLFCRSCKSRAVGPVENVSVGAVDCGNGRKCPDHPARQHYPAGERRPQTGFAPPPRSPGRGRMEANPVLRDGNGVRGQIRAAALAADGPGRRTPSRRP